MGKKNGDFGVWLTRVIDVKGDSSECIFETLKREFLYWGEYLAKREERLREIVNLQFQSQQTTLVNFESLYAESNRILDIEYPLPFHFGKNNPF